MEIEEGERKSEHGNTSDLPTNLTEEILARLPAMSLCRFRCVSRSWAMLLASDAFVELHLRHANQGHPKVFRLPLTWSNYQVPIYSWEATDPVMRLLSIENIVDLSSLSTTTACRGLFLFRGFDLHHLLNTNHHYYIFNPSIGDILALPDGSPPMDAYDHSAQTGWFDILFGLGYDSSSKEYKVARIYTYFKSINFISTKRCEILTVGVSKHWRLAVEQPPSYIDWNQTDGVFSDGCLHWMLADSADSQPDSGYILCFDIHNETFSTIQLPLGIRISLMGVLTKLDECLCFHYFSDGYGKEAIWMLDDYKASRWEKYCAFDRQAWPTAERKLVGNYEVTPLAMYYGSGQKRKFMFVTNNDVVFAIDPDNGALEILLFPGETADTWYGRLMKSPQLQLFVESLAFVANPEPEQVTCSSPSDN